MKMITTFKLTLISIVLMIAFSEASFAETAPMTLENIFDNNGSVMLIIDPINGEILNANHAAAAFYGYSIDELKRMKIEQINNLTPGEIQAEMARAFAQERNYFNFEHRLKDGSIRYVEVYSYPYSNDTSDDLLLSTIYDITPRLLAEKKSLQNRMTIYILAIALFLSLAIAFVSVKKSHKETKHYSMRIQNLFDNMNEGFAVHEVIFDANGKPIDYVFIEVNKAFETITGLKSEDIKNRRITEVLPNTERYWIEKYGEVALTGASDQFVNYSGELDKYFSVSVYSPSKNHFATLFTDVSELKKLEETISREKNLLLTTLNTLVDGVISTDLRGQIDIMNPAAEKLTGWSASEAKGKLLESVFCISQEKNILLTRKDGVVIPIEYASAPVTDPSVESRGHVIIFRDYTEKLEKESRILYLSYHDQLTGLYNRRFFEEESIRLNTVRNLPLTLAVCDVNGLKLTNDAFGHLAGDELLKKISDILRSECRADDIIARIGGDEFAIIFPQTDSKDAEKIVSRIYDATQVYSVSHIVLSLSIGWSTKTDMRQSMDDIFISAEELMYRRKLTESQSMRNQTIRTILNTLYTQNQREKHHAERVSIISIAIGRALGLDYNTLKDLETAALMHDIGKIVIDTALLTKPGEISEKEYDEIKRHPECGYQILKSVDQYSDLADYVLSHHEHWNGKGYPRGLAGDEIPLISRIITIADAFDSMTTDRPYRSAMNADEATKELLRCSGNQFDPDIIHIFMKLDMK